MIAGSSAASPLVATGLVSATATIEIYLEHEEIIKISKKNKVI